MGHPHFEAGPRLGHLASFLRVNGAGPEGRSIHRFLQGHECPRSRRLTTSKPLDFHAAAHGNRFTLKGAAIPLRPNRPRSSKCKGFHLLLPWLPGWF